MKHILMVIAAVFLVCAAAQAQDREVVVRDGLMQVMAAHANDGEAVLQHHVDAYLATLSRQDAAAAEVGVLKWARKQGVIDKLDMSRSMLKLNQRYFPEDEAALDYWRYMVMITAKLRRGEISVEEVDYLEGKKLAEVRRGRREQEELADAVAAAAAAESEAQNRQAVGATLLGIGNALRRRPAGVACTTVGITTTCNPR